MDGHEFGPCISQEIGLVCGLFSIFLSLFLCHFAVPFEVKLTYNYVTHTNMLYV
jgi:hypothetical protein